VVPFGFTAKDSTLNLYWDSLFSDPFGALGQELPTFARFALYGREIERFPGYWPICSESSKMGQLVI
jgi:hypothetical protein